MCGETDAATPARSDRAVVFACDGTYARFALLAAEQIAHNTGLLRPGTSFRDLVERARNPPADCFPARYGVLYHGVGLADEYPTLPHAADWTDDTPDGVLEAGMVLCAESYIGRLGGREGVKIEEQRASCPHERYVYSDNETSPFLPPGWYCALCGEPRFEPTDEQLRVFEGETRRRAT